MKEDAVNAQRRRSTTAGQLTGRKAEVVVGESPACRSIGAGRSRSAHAPRRPRRHVRRRTSGRSHIAAGRRVSAAEAPHGLPSARPIRIARIRHIRERGKFENPGGFALPSFGKPRPVCPALTERDPGTHGGRDGGTFQHRAQGGRPEADDREGTSGPIR